MKYLNKILIVVIVVLVLSIVVTRLNALKQVKEQSSSEDKSIATTQEKPPLVGGDKDEHGCLASAGFSWCEVKQQCQRMWETLCITDEDASILAQSVSKAVQEKRGPSAADLLVKIHFAEGNYAKGGLSPKNPDAGGAMWFAAKVNGTWELVWDGNGNILCSDLTNYPDFPSVYIPECLDTKTMQTVQRNQ
jgi:hypothetical protein